MLKLLLIEQRDEVFSRLAADLSELGCVVERAVTVAEAVLCCRNRTMAITVCYRDFLEESGWLIASKLRLLDSSARIWLYAVSFDPFDRVGAEYSGIEDLLYYEGDLFRLSKQLAARLWKHQNKLRLVPDCGPHDPVAQADAHLLLARSLQTFRSVA